MVKIVADTAVGYSRAEAESRGVTIVGLNYSISGINYTETFRGENGDFFKAMHGRLCRTSQPSPQDFRDVFSKIIAEGNEVLCITISEALSGTYSSACLAAREFNDKVKVVDSRAALGAMHMLVDEAVNMAVGGMCLNKIAQTLPSLSPKINTVFTVENLEPLRKGGRLVIPTPNTMLNSRPILQCECRIKFITNVRGIKARNDALIAAIPDTARRIFLMKSGANTDTSELETKLAQKFPNSKIHLRTAGPVLTVHLGEGAYGIAYLLN